MVMTFPPFLAGALAFKILPELGFDTGSLGAALGGFFGLSAISSATIGGLADRIGWPAAMRVSSAMSAVTKFGIAGLAHSWLSFAALISLGGLTMAIGQPAVNLALAREVPVSRQGFVFGLKHSAVPAAAMLSGFAVPLFAVNGDWRGVFVGAGVIAGGVALAVPKSPARLRRRGLETLIRKRSNWRCGRSCSWRSVPLLAASVASALSAFLVISVIDSGVSPGGRWFDPRHGKRHGTDSPPSGRLVGRRSQGRRGSEGSHCSLWSVPQVLERSPAPGHGCSRFAAMLAFGAGWGWNGLFNFSVVKHFPRAPARATSVALTGTYIGAALGPIVMGQVIEIYSFQAAWLAAAALSSFSAVAMLAARWQLTDMRKMRAAAIEVGPDGSPRRRLTGIVPTETV